MPRGGVTFACSLLRLARSRAAATEAQRHALRERWLMNCQLSLRPDILAGNERRDYVKKGNQYRQQTTP